jgi:hypothetical protein
MRRRYRKPNKGEPHRFGLVEERPKSKHRRNLKRQRRNRE